VCEQDINFDTVPLRRPPSRKTAPEHLICRSGSLRGQEIIAIIRVDDAPLYRFYVQLLRFVGCDEDIYILSERLVVGRDEVSARTLGTRLILAQRAEAALPMRQTFFTWTWLTSMLIVRRVILHISSSVAVG